MRVLLGLDGSATLDAGPARLEADLIVSGTRGRTGITRVLLGSVACNVMLHAACSVLVVGGGPAAGGPAAGGPSAGAG